MLNNRYYLVIFIMYINIIIHILTPQKARSQEKNTIKTFDECITTFNTNKKTKKQFEDELLSRATESAVMYFFGVHLESITIIQGIEITSDEIKSSCSGYVSLINKDPYQGKESGEFCLAATFEAKREEVERLKIKPISGIGCADQDISYEKSDNEAKYRAKLNALYEFEPKLKNISNQDIIVLLLKQSEYTDKSNSSSCCKIVAGKVHPLEMETFLKTYKKKKPVRPKKTGAAALVKREQAKPFVIPRKTKETIQVERYKTKTNAVPKKTKKAAQVKREKPKTFVIPIKTKGTIQVERDTKQRDIKSGNAKRRSQKKRSPSQQKKCAEILREDSLGISPISESDVKLLRTCN